MKQFFLILAVLASIAAFAIGGLAPVAFLICATYLFFWHKGEAYTTSNSRATYSVLLYGGVFSAVGAFFGGYWWTALIGAAIFIATAGLASREARSARQRRQRGGW